MTLLLAACLLAPADGLPKLGFEVEGADEAWAKFLGEMFAHFDRDGDKTWSPAEAVRSFALPDAPIDFATLDGDRDGKATAVEWQAFAAKAGFRPVVVTVAPPDADAVRLGEAVFAALDADGDGVMRAAEFARAPRLLRRFDEDEDEYLTPPEILTTAPKRDPPRRKLETSGAPDAVLRFTDKGVRISVPRADDVRLRSSDGRFVVTGPGWVVAGPAGEIRTGRAATGFVRAQFRAALGDGDSIAAAAVESDPAASLLKDIFPFADRDGDGKLAAGEAETYLNLIDLGFASRAMVTLTPRGRNVFDALDANGDGRLSVAELGRAADALSGGDIRRESVPDRFEVRMGRGGFRSLGRIPAAAPAQAAPAKVAGARPGPAWFAAMDRNGDGILSAREYLGPPAAFARLDRNADGIIDPTEAAEGER